MAGKGSVLIIGLESMPAMLLSNYLSTVGYDVRAAQETGEGLALLESWNPEALVVDERVLDSGELPKEVVERRPTVVLVPGERRGQGLPSNVASVGWPTSRDEVARAVEELLRERRVEHIISAANILDSQTVPAIPSPRVRKRRTHIGRYQVLGLIGRGGMGEVYRCYDPTEERVVAVKTMPCAVETADGKPDPMVERFRVEAAALSRLVHPRIVAIVHFGVDEEANEMFLVMQLVDGPSLRHRLDNGGPLELEVALQIGWDMADALAHAHEHGVIHRDVKPENVLIDELGRPMLTDFGLARLGDFSISDGQAVAGTPNYMAPEQLLDPRGVDARADQYGLGALFYEMLAGRESERKTSPASVFSRIMSPRPPLRKLGVEISDALDQFIQRLLQPEPEDRFPDDIELLHQLAGIGAELGLMLERY